MCGICGVLSYDRSRPVPAQLLRSMAEVMRVRGPDGSGEFVGAGVGLAARRLAILDLTAAASQPMPNEDGTIRVVFNGAIYNHADLRCRLEARGHVFRSHTDTETIVHLWEEFGERCVDHLRGMFALAVWDAVEERLFLARDRAGEKPLFYADTGECFVFASDLKAILPHAGVDRRVDEDALQAYLAFQSVPAPYTAYRGIRKLQPAHTLLVRRNGPQAPRRYWQLSYLKTAPDRPEAQMQEELAGRLRVVVRERLQSDVAVGALLSGGLDSSLTVGLMTEATGAPVQTFSVGFDQAEYNELPYARQVARRHGTAHHETIVTAAAASVFPALTWHYGEPFADSSAIPTYFAFQLARRHATVVLTGDGGDENFAGYQRYQDLGGRAALVSRARWLTGTAVSGSAAAAAGWRRLRQLTGPQISYYYRQVAFDEFRRQRLLTPEFAARLDPFLPMDWMIDKFRASDAESPEEQAMSVDLQLYLPDTLQTKTDVSSMAHSVEARSPFLDHSLMEFVAALPARMKLRGGVSKYVLRQVAAPCVPRQILTRTKMGFGVPIDHWFRHELKDLTHDTLLSRQALQRGYFREATVRRFLNSHQRGVNRHQQIWFLLMFEWWHQQFVDRSAAIAEPPAEATA